MQNLPTELVSHILTECGLPLRDVLAFGKTCKSFLGIALPCVYDDIECEISKHFVLLNFYKLLDDDITKSEQVSLQKLASIQKYCHFTRRLEFQTPNDSLLTISFHPGIRFLNVLKVFPGFRNLTVVYLYAPENLKVKDYILGVDLIVRSNPKLSRLSLLFSCSIKREDVCEVHEIPEVQSSPQLKFLEIDVESMGIRDRDSSQDGLKARKAENLLRILAKILGLSTRKCTALAWRFPTGEPGDRMVYENTNSNRTWEFPSLEHLNVQASCFYFDIFNKYILLNPAKITEITEIEVSNNLYKKIIAIGLNFPNLRVITIDPDWESWDFWSLWCEGKSTFKSQLQSLEEIRFYTSFGLESVQNNMKKLNVDERGVRFTEDVITPGMHSPQERMNLVTIYWHLA